MIKVTFPIDIVITWVDQSDPKWQEKFKKVKGVQEDEEIRYRDYGTLRYVFRSIEKFAPWVHHVFLVTDDQVPSWLNESYSKLTVVDHKEIIPREYLPTFNSNVIDFHLKNIPGLAEHFIYFNDDMFLTKYTNPGDFFTDNGFIKDNLAFNLLLPSPEPGSNFDHIYVNNLQIVNKQFPKRKTQKKLFWKLFNLKNGWWNLISLLLFPFPRFGRFFDPHIPLAFRKSDINSVIGNNKIIRNMFSNRVREFSDFSIWLVRYCQLLDGNFVPRSVNFGRHYSLEDIDIISKDLKKKKYSAVCINDADVSYDIFLDLAKRLSKILNTVFPDKSSFEK